MAEIPSGRAASLAPEFIESRDNRWLKWFRAALAGDAVRPRGETQEKEAEIAAVEGARLVRTALRSGVEIVALLLSETGAKHLNGLAPLIPPEARLLRTTDRLFAAVSGTETPQGIAALIRPRLAALDHLITGLPFILILAGVQDPGNVGTLVRTAEAFGASGIAACAAGGIGTANPFCPKALRASAGSSLRLPILRGISAPVLLAQLRIAGVRVCAACPEEASGLSAAHRETGAAAANTNPVAPKPLAPWQIDWRAPIALLIGNEGAGLPPDLIRSADAIVSIPHTVHDELAADHETASAESLNAAVAGSILLYEAARQRGLGLMR